VPAQVVAPAREDRVQAAVRAEVERHEHGGVDAAVDLERRGLGGKQQDVAQELRDAVAGQVARRLSGRGRRARHARRT
jgi:tRNA(Ser,Leu) C12 N-acetylase TAN1